MPKFDWQSKKCGDEKHCHQDHLFLVDQDTGQIYASVHGPDEFGHFSMYRNDLENSDPAKYTNSAQALGGAMQFAERFTTPQPDTTARILEMLSPKLYEYLDKLMPRPPGASNTSANTVDAEFVDGGSGRP